MTFRSDEELSERIIFPITEAQANGIEVIVRRVDFNVGDLSGRRVVFRRKRMNAIPEPPRRHGEHAPQLSAAEHSDRRTGQNQV